MNEQHPLIRGMVRGAYDIQKLRVATGNRIVAQFRVKLGIQPSTKEKDEAEAGKLLDDLRTRYKRITDGVVELPSRRGFEGDEIISTHTELALVHGYMQLLKTEEGQFKALGHELDNVAIWTEFLKGVKGVGPAMGGVIISEIDIRLARYPSSLWAYSGMDVAEDGRGRSKRKEHLVEREYVDREGETATRVGITFNPFLKTKLLGVLASSFLRVSQSPYHDVYNDYKHRLESHARYGIEHDGELDENGKMMSSKGRRHNMAMRYMIKMFLVDLYKAWRALEGLTVSPPYHEAKLRMKEHAA